MSKSRANLRPLKTHSYLISNVSRNCPKCAKCLSDWDTLATSTASSRTSPMRGMRPSEQRQAWGQKPTRHQGLEGCTSFQERVRRAGQGDEWAYTRNTRSSGLEGCKSPQERVRQAGAGQGDEPADKRSSGLEGCKSLQEEVRRGRREGEETRTRARGAAASRDARPSRTKSGDEGKQTSEPAG